MKKLLFIVAMLLSFNVLANVPANVSAAQMIETEYIKATVDDMVDLCTWIFKDNANNVRATATRGCVIGMIWHEAFDVIPNDNKAMDALVVKMTNYFIEHHKLKIQ